MADFSYITRALLGLGSPTNFRYDGAFAVSTHSENSAQATINYNVGQPSHIMLRSSTVPVTDLNLPGVTNAQGALVNGLSYFIKNTSPKGSASGDNYTIKVKVAQPGGVEVIVTLYEQEAAHVVYNAGDFTWQLMSHLTAW